MTSEQSSSVGPAVESEIFHLFLKLRLFSGSAMQKGNFAPICAHSLKSIICTKLAINNEEFETTKEYSTSCMGHFPETCIIVSQERMLLPGMTTRLHLYDLNNIAALEDALSRDGTFSLVRF